MVLNLIVFGTVSSKIIDEYTKKCDKRYIKVPSNKFGLVVVSKSLPNVPRTYLNPSQFLYLFLLTPNH